MEMLVGRLFYHFIIYLVYHYDLLIVCDTISPPFTVPFGKWRTGGPRQKEIREMEVRVITALAVASATAVFYA